MTRNESGGAHRSANRDVTLRPATEVDREAIATLHRASIRALAASAYDEAVVDAWTAPIEPGVYEVEPENGAVVVAERAAAADGELLAYGDVRFHAPAYLRSDVDGEVRAVYVAPEHARTGVGTAVLSRLDSLARRTGCGSLGALCSVNARPFYESRGWVVVAERSHEFGGEVAAPAVEMRTQR